MMPLINNAMFAVSFLSNPDSSISEPFAHAVGLRLTSASAVSISAIPSLTASHLSARN